MTHRAWICLLFAATLSWGQAVKPAATAAAPPPAPPAAPKMAPPSTTAAAKAPEGASVSPDAAVITIPGLCEKPPVDKSKAASCNTVVTRAEFEQIVEAVAPNIAAGARKQLATQYGTALVMVHKAHQMGLDQGPKFQELMKVARVGVLTKELSQSLQEQAGHVTDKEVEDYYHNNEPAFQEADLQRVFIPRSKQSDDSKSKPGDEAAKQRQQESEDAMKKEAEALRARAASGEDFDKLQEEAAAPAEFKAKPPTKLGKVRRTSLPPTQAEVMDLKPGEVSQLISTPNGYLIYKVGEKDSLPLDKVREEIVSTLRSQRMQASMQAIQQSATPELNEEYFADAPAAAPQGKAPSDAGAKPLAKAPVSGPK